MFEKGAARKAIIVGLDGARWDYVKRLVDEGKLPNIARLVRSGVFAACLPTNSPHTTPGWVSIATGAWPGTTGINVGTRLLGQPIHASFDGMDAKYCKAEHLWDAAGRVGKKSIVMTYPCSEPVEDGIYIGKWGFSSIRIAQEHLFSSVKLEPCMPLAETKLARIVRSYKNTPIVQVKPIEGWSNVPKSFSQPLETVITISPVMGEARNFYVLILDSKGKGYDRIAMFRSKDDPQAIATTSVGEWSNWIRTKFKTPEGEREGTHRFRLIDLSTDARIFKLYATEVFPIDGWTYPPSVAEEILENVGPIQEHNSPFTFVGEDIFLDEAMYQAKWSADTAKYLMEHYEWHLFMMHFHLLDSIKHFVHGFCDPKSLGYDPELAPRCWEIITRSYQICDYLVGRFMELEDEETLITVVSDHGHVSAHGLFYINNILAKEDLLKIGENNRIDWSKTKAYAHEFLSVYINVKGRDPGGIVDPGEEYEDVRKKIIKALYNMRDPRTGDCPIALAMNQEDAAGLGLYGDTTPDVVYFTKPGYMCSATVTNDLKIFEPIIPPLSKHEQHLSLFKDVQAMFAMSGPGVRKGYARRAPIRVIDVAPIVAYLLGIPFPQQADGAIPVDILE